MNIHHAHDITFEYSLCYEHRSLCLALKCNCFTRHIPFKLIFKLLYWFFKNSWKYYHVFCTLWTEIQRDVGSKFSPLGRHFICLTCLSPFWWLVASSLLAKLLCLPSCTNLIVKQFICWGASAPVHPITSQC